jgi:hypothetical protein
VLITALGQSPEDIWLYDRAAHVLRRLSNVNIKARKKLAEESNEVIPENRGIQFWMAAQPSRLTKHYFFAESLVWRDAGVLLGTWGILAEASGLSSCSLGITGEPWVSRLTRSAKSVVGVGGWVVGSRLK